MLLFLGMWSAVALQGGGGYYSVAAYVDSALTSMQNTDAARKSVVYGFCIATRLRKIEI